MVGASGATAPVPVATAQAPAAPVVAVVLPPNPAPPVVQAATDQPAAQRQDPASMLAADYREGLLTFVADHVTLKKALDLIGSKTGASIDLAPDMASELIAARLGPATPNEVLSALLDSPKIDYIILGSSTQGGIQKVVVRRKQGFGRQPMAVAAMSRPAANTAVQDEIEAQNQTPAASPVNEATSGQQDGPPPKE